jgi:hypothetical protein
MVRLKTTLSTSGRGRCFSAPSALALRLNITMSPEEVRVNMGGDLGWMATRPVPAEAVRVGDSPLGLTTLSFSIPSLAVELIWT